MTVRRGGCIDGHDTGSGVVGGGVPGVMGWWGTVRTMEVPRDHRPGPETREIDEKPIKNR